MLSRDKGFTLIESVLVIVLVAVLAVAVTTITTNYRRSHIEVVSQKIRSDLEHARSLAMTKKGTPFGVLFDKANNRYTVYETNISTPVLDPQTKQNLVENFSRWPGVSILSNDYMVEFNSFGAPTIGGGGSVQVTDGTNNKTVRVDADTGRVTVQ